MESQGVVLGNPDIDAGTRYVAHQTSRRTSRRTSRQSGRDGQNRESSSDDLDTRPLLSRDIDQLPHPMDYRAVPDEDPEDDQEEQGWSGANDFEGLPWWKKPSVCHIHHTRAFPYTNYTLARYGGFSDPSSSTPSPLAALSYPD